MYKTKLKVTISMEATMKQRKEQSQRVITISIVEDAE